MTSLLWFLLGTMAGAPLGFLLCAAFTAGKRAAEERNVSDIFSGLVAVVQYRRKADGVAWHAMAAFDQRGVAERYADDCGKGDRPWEYRVVDVPEAQAQI